MSLARRFLGGALYTILYIETREPAKPAHRASNGFNNLRGITAATGSDPDPRLQLILYVLPIKANTYAEFSVLPRVPALTHREHSIFTAKVATALERIPGAVQESMPPFRAVLYPRSKFLQREAIE